MEKVKLSIKNTAETKPTVLYLDNFEDVLHSGQDGDSKRDTETLRLLTQLKEIHNISILISCRENITGINHSFPLPLLSVNSAADLFVDTWNGSEDAINNHRDDIYKFIEEELACHPLSIVLAASQGFHTNSIDDLINEWRSYGDAEVDMADNPDHTSLNAAISSSYKIISSDPICKTIWGVTSFFTRELKCDHYERILGADHEEVATASRLMCKLNLLQTGTEGYTMLPPIKDKIFEYVGDDVCYGKAHIINMLIDYYRTLLDKATDNQNYTNIDHLTVLYFLDDILDFLGIISKDNTANSCSEIEALIILLSNYYQFRTASSAKLLGDLLDECDANDSFSKAKSHITRILGNLQRRLGNTDGALELYNRAEKLYKSEGANLGLANTLRSMGDLQRRLGNTDRALELYNRAEKLYESEGANLGLANTLRSMGNLHSKLGNHNRALELFDRAEKLYKSEGRNLGLANTLRSMGDLHSKLGNHNRALELFDRAEILYKSEGGNLGLANTLQSIGDDYREQKMYQDALNKYKAALELYKSEREPLGTGYTLGELVRINALLGDSDACNSYIEEVTPLMDTFSENVSGYITACIREALDILDIDDDDDTEDK